jgi:phenylalanine-4-hydroxylase
VLPFEPAVTALQKYPITEYQPVYYECESFASMTKKLKDYAASLQRPFTVALNPYASKVIVTAK